MSGEEDDEVPNQYRLALEDELPRIRGQASICTFAYDAVQTALENGAWQSSTADEFSADLSTHISNAATAGENCEQAFQNRYDGEPETVPEDHPHAHWSPRVPGLGGPNGPI